MSQLSEEAAAGVLAAPAPMLTMAIWTKVYWPFLECLALSVPFTGDASGKVAQALKLVLETLPCQLCAWHATAYIERKPFDASSRAKAYAWVIDFRNSINARNGKKEFSVAAALGLRMQRWAEDAQKDAQKDTQKDTGLNAWFVSGLVIAVIGVVAIGVAAFVLARYRFRSRSREVSEASEASEVSE